MQATPQSRSLPTQGASPPPSAPHSRDTAYSASSLRSEPSEASHSSMQSFSTSSMRRLDLGAQSSVGDQTGDLYDIFEPRSSVEQEGGPGAEHDPAATWRLRDVEAVKLLTGADQLLCSSSAAGPACLCTVLCCCCSSIARTTSHRQQV